MLEVNDPVNSNKVMSIRSAYLITLFLERREIENKNKSRKIADLPIPALCSTNVAQVWQNWHIQQPRLTFTLLF